jgi:hypothetical protein
MLFAPAVAMVVIMAIGVIVIGVRRAPGLGLVPVVPPVPMMIAVPIAVAIAEGDIAQADRDMIRGLCRMTVSVRSEALVGVEARSG